MDNSLRLSENYGLNKSQWELDFVDIPLNTDIELFIDPYAIKISSSKWCQECHEQIITYFTLVVQSIKDKNDSLARRLLSNLHEPNDTHLGMSSGKPTGRGIGGVQGDQLFKAFKNSKAARTGFLSDLDDCVLFIEGIGRDKISDITTNIIKGKLIEYTLTQCELHGIPTRRIGTGKFFDFSDLNWKNKYEDLPHYDGKRILLVPKDAVRRTSNVSPERFYDFVIDYLQAEHEKPGDSLVHVLKNGKLRVFKKDLKEIYPYSRDFLFDFTLKNPDVYYKFKEENLRPSLGISDNEIEAKQLNPQQLDALSKSKELEAIPMGSDFADDYHNLIIGVLSLVFGDRIRRPKKEHKQNEGRKRIDITYENARIGFFEDLIFLHQIKCPYIIVECKNYSHDLKNPEFDQLTGRLNDRVGRFGLLLCRSIENEVLLVQRLKDIANSGNGYVIVLTDRDLINLLELKSKKQEDEIDNYLNELLKKVLF